VGRIGLEETVDVDDSWIRHHIGKAAFHAPSGTVITYEDRAKGYILNRNTMQRDIAEQCARDGADCLFDTRITEVSAPAGTRRTVVFDTGKKVAARVVIDAGGPRSPFGKEEGIAWKPFDLEPAYFALIENAPLSNDTVHLYVGRELAPGGYAWAFPSEGNTANVGILVGSEFRGKVNIRSLLSSFLESQFPGCNVLRYFGGAIPCGYRRATIALPGLIKAGDAASTINPISRAGIVEAMMCGELAGQFAVRMLGAGSTREARKLCKKYEKAWYEKRGKRHLKLARVKGLLPEVSDHDYNTGAQALSGMKPSKLTMAKIFGRSLGRYPRLVWALRHLM
jgi:flavin-dependent dehydrogenase